MFVVQYNLTWYLGLPKVNHWHFSTRLGVYTPGLCEFIDMLLVEGELKRLCTSVHRTTRFLAIWSVLGLLQMVWPHIPGHSTTVDTAWSILKKGDCLNRIDTDIPVDYKMIIPCLFFISTDLLARATKTARALFEAARKGHTGLSNSSMQHQCCKDY